LETREDVLAILLAAQQFESRIEGFCGGGAILLQKEKYAHLMDDPNTGELETKRHGCRQFINVDILLYVDTLIHHCRVLKVMIRCHIAQYGLNTFARKFSPFPSFDRPHQENDSRMSSQRVISCNGIGYMRGLSCCFSQVNGVATSCEDSNS
jgi:hypothetical protein